MAVRSDAGPSGESRLRCFHQETTDYARPIVFVVQVRLQDSDHGPVLDDSWPTVMRTEVRGGGGVEALIRSK